MFNFLHTFDRNSIIFRWVQPTSISDFVCPLVSSSPQITARINVRQFYTGMLVPPKCLSILHSMLVSPKCLSILHWYVYHHPEVCLCLYEKNKKEIHVVQNSPFCLLYLKDCFNSIKIGNSKLL